MGFSAYSFLFIDNLHCYTILIVWHFGLKKSVIYHALPVLFSFEYLSFSIYQRNKLHLLHHHFRGYIHLFFHCVTVKSQLNLCVTITHWKYSLCSMINHNISANVSGNNVSNKMQYYEYISFCQVFNIFV